MTCSCDPALSGDRCSFRGQLACESVLSTGIEREHVMIARRKLTAQIDVAIVEQQVPTDEWPIH